MSLSFQNALGSTFTQPLVGGVTITKPPSGTPLGLTLLGDVIGHAPPYSVEVDFDEMFNPIINGGSTFFGVGLLDTVSGKCLTAFISTGVGSSFLSGNRYSDFEHNNSQLIPPWVPPSGKPQFRVVDDTVTRKYQFKIAGVDDWTTIAETPSNDFFVGSSTDFLGVVMANTTTSPAITAFAKVSKIALG